MNLWYFLVFIYKTAAYRRKTDLLGQQEQDVSSIAAVIRFLDCLHFVFMSACMYVQRFVF